MTALRIAAALALAALAACTASLPDTITQKPPEPSYVEKMERADRNVFMMSSESSDFVEIVLEPAPYMMDTLRYLAQPGPSERQKMMAAEAMAHLDLESFLYFGKMMIALYNKGTINEKIFSFGALPALEYLPKIYENYQDDRVRAYLQAILALPNLSDNCQDFVEDVLRGKVNEDIRDMRDAGVL